MPSRVCVLRQPQSTGTNAARTARHEGQRPAEFGQQPIGLSGVALRATCDAVLPRMRAAAAAWNHVVDGVPGASTVGAPLSVPAQHPRPGDRRGGRVRHPDEPVQAQDCGDRQRETRRSELLPGRTLDETLGLASQHQHHRPTAGQYGQRLVGGVQQQDPGDPGCHVCHVHFHHPLGHHSPRWRPASRLLDLVNLADGPMGQHFLATIATSRPSGPNAAPAGGRSGQRE